MMLSLFHAIQFMRWWWDKQSTATTFDHFFNHSTLFVVLVVDVPALYPLIWTHPVFMVKRRWVINTQLYPIRNRSFELSTFQKSVPYRAAAKRWECAEPRYHYNCHPTKGENLSLSLSLTHLPPLDFSNIAPTHKLFGSTLKCGVVNGPSPQALKLKLFFPTRFSPAWLKPWPCRSSLFLFPVPKKTRILTEHWILPTSFSFMNHGALERNFCSQIPHNLIAYVGGHFYTIPTWWFLY